MTDIEFHRAFESLKLEASKFHHRDHVQLTWLLVRGLGPAGAADELRTGIRNFAESHGQAEKYHDTITCFWVKLVGHMVETHPEVETFEEFERCFPHALDKSLIFRHWSRTRLFSPEARATWVEPDLLEIPF
ncbi:MAG TPA: hypothetical protein VFB34_08615 [Chloroflexota bacterium]|nr:hypothetical protein [Chloroflexota bacterium]